MPRTKQTPFLLCPFCKKNIPNIQLKPSIKQMNILISCPCLQNKQILNLHQFIKKLKSNQILDVNYCHKHNTIQAEKYCSNCSLWLCKECNKSHLEHNIINHEINIQCRKHNKPCTLNCKQYNHFTCKDCFSFNDDSLNQQLYDFTQLLSHLDQVVHKFLSRIDNNDAYTKMKNSIQSIYKVNKRINKDLVLLYKIIQKTIVTYKTPPLLKNSIRINTLKYKDKELSIEREFDKLNEYLQKHYIIKQPENKRTAKLIQSTIYFICLAVLHDGRLASGSNDALIRLWNINNNKCTATLTGHVLDIFCLIVLKDGRLVSGAHDGKIKLWNTTTHQCLNTITAHIYYHVNCLLELSNGQLASGSNDHTIKLWNLLTYQSTTTITGDFEPVYCLTELNDCRLACGSYQTITLCNTYGNPNMSTLLEHEQDVNCLVVLNDGKLASASSDYYIKLWNTLTNQCITTLIGDKGFYCLYVLSDGRLASGSYENVILWNTLTYERKEFMTRNTKQVYSVTELDDGRLVSGSYETIHIWDV